MDSSKEECDKSARENWHLARMWDEQGKHKEAEAARGRAIEDEKCRSWWYRTFGW